MMLRSKEEITTAALKLDPAEREALAEELLLSIDAASRDAIDDAWLIESRRRDTAFLAGQAQAKPVEQVIDRLLNKARP